MAYRTANQDRIVEATFKIQTHPGRVWSHTRVRDGRSTSTFNQRDVSEIILRNEKAEMD